VNELELGTIEAADEDELPVTTPELELVPDTTELEEALGSPPSPPEVELPA
jgi:hypothetical protein